jgi:hypothetical protein
MTPVDSRLVSALEEQLRRRPDAERGGWKLGIGERERLGGIAVGSLTSATVLEPGSEYRYEGGDLHADAEIAVRVGPRGEIAGYAPALELGDLSARLGEARRVLEAAGERLQPGDQVITGNIVQVPVGPRDHLEADLGALGKVSPEIR